ncbi:MAG: cellulose biosynthesis protein BcsE [Ewingella sp.]
MALSFPFGMKKFWNESAEMQTSGLYWVNTHSQDDAHELGGQVLEAQAEDIVTTFIFPMDNTIPGNVTQTLTQDNIFVSKILSKTSTASFYQLANGKKAFRSLPDDLNRVSSTQNQLIVLFFPATAWQNLSDKEFGMWLKGMSALAQHKNCVLLIICHGLSSILKAQLNSHHRLIYGLSSFQTDIVPAQFVISWWHNNFGVEANNAYLLEKRENGWGIISQSSVENDTNTLSDDQWLYLAQREVLEGAPPLSENWQLFDDNAALTERGMHARAATLIFSLRSNDEVEILARQIHSLRIQRGNRLKIAVREMNASLRYIDQRLLQACGANLVVPHAARLSSFLTLLDDIQQLSFMRYIAADIEKLLEGRLPTHHKGFLPLPTFCEVMQSIWRHTTLTTEARGVLISLRPVSGILPQQAISLCHLRRDGDVITLTERHLYLFLSNCQVSDVENVLNSLFSLPVDEIFASRTFWHQDRDIQSEVRRLAAKKTLPEQALRPQQVSAPVSHPQQRASVHLPEPLTLTLSNTPVSRSVAETTRHLNKSLRDEQE